MLPGALAVSQRLKIQYIKEVKNEDTSVAATCNHEVSFLENGF